MYGYEWTDEYGIFRLTVDTRLQKEIRPVFKEELDYFHMDQYWDYPDTTAPILWAEGIRRYILNGNCVALAQGGDFYNRPIIVRQTEEPLKLQPIDVNRLYDANSSMMKSLEHRAISFIRKQYEKYSPQQYSFICAFSGGKDSLALLDLCSKALAPSEFNVIFSDTGMELSDTYATIQKAKKIYSELHFYEAKSHMDPDESWNEFGPPGRRMRWCCTVHKSVPTLLKLREITHNYNAKAIVYDGVRAEESVKRASYDEVVVGAKNINQINCHPILKWNTAELYSYLLKNDLLINNAYRIGLFRVGCKICPLSSEWWEGIANDVYASEIEPLAKIVENYAKNAKGENEARNYIINGGWKARLGGKGLPNGGNRVNEIIENNKIVFTIRDYRQKWQNVEKILGPIVEQNEKTGIQKIGNNYYTRIISLENDFQKITYYPFSKMDRFVVSHLRGVANKTAYCIGCKACTVQCPTGAFTIQPDNSILIRESLCIHCHNCIEFSDRSCIVANNMRVPEGGFINMKGLDPYHHFGFRQSWLSHFMDEGVDCFSKGQLGTVQYNALRVWLKDAEIIDVKKTGNAQTIYTTKLGEKLTKMGAYNPLTWAIIWANLSYNSTICRWYSISIGVASTYEKGDLVTLLGDNNSKSNRENAITALLDLFKQSPIGANLGQGIPISKTGYLRDGWQELDGVVLLYSLYLFAEHTGRYSLTLTEMIKAHDNPEGNGVNPGDIFGIDNKKLRECIQGLALTFPEYIRVSFINDLDNIVLDKKYTSLSILDLLVA